MSRLLRERALYNIFLFLQAYFANNIYLSVLK